MSELLVPDWVNHTRRRLFLKLLMIAYFGDREVKLDTFSRSNDGLFGARLDHQGEPLELDWMIICLIILEVTQLSVCFIYVVMQLCLRWVLQDL